MRMFIDLWILCRKLKKDQIKGERLKLPFICNVTDIIIIAVTALHTPHTNIRLGTSVLRDNP